MLRTLLVCAVAVLMTSTLCAENQFRCDTEVFAGKDTKPVQQTLTMFDGKVVYDFMLGKPEKPEEITVFDLGRGQITLLDPARKLKTTILRDDMLEWTATYKTVKAESELFIFCTQPTFKEKFTDDTLTLSSKQFSYEAVGVKPEQSGSEVLYRQFADWSARLNGMRPGNLPPFPRLQLNESLAAKGLLPRTIKRTISTAHLTGRRSETVRSEHLFNPQLSAGDKKQIEEVGDRLIEFKAVSWKEYLGLNPVQKTAMR